ncbi:RICIN domain-containing protein [Streptomyces flavotricini]|uniref:RICIN domain-containing protein n=1 Tax=Streptomyces flavotricini TaxID=66888 RepID=A0ABS8EH09_9ACTN|nr:RICIN domain-containing protein [Streptomyces flavotricini]MCC0100350.1 RICIN domain-containing protein [Streptomyces flavotricini]
MAIGVRLPRGSAAGKSVLPALVLAAAGSSPATLATAGAQAVLRAGNSSNPGRYWKVTQNASGAWTITNPATGYSLDSAPVAPGASVTADPATNANTPGTGPPSTDRAAACPAR